MVRDTQVLLGYSLAWIESYCSRTDWSGANVQHPNRFGGKPTQEIGEEERRARFELELSIERVVPNDRKFRVALTRRPRNNYRSSCNARNRYVIVKGLEHL